MSDQLLKDLKIIEFCARLPGPYASMVLAKQGASVTKIEDTNFGDPFASTEMAKLDPSFADWYSEINNSKNILRHDYTKNLSSEILQEIAQADVIVVGIPLKFIQAMGLEKNEIEKINKKITYIELHASRDDLPSMHDLNAMAQTGILELYLNDFQGKDIVAPPFMPFFGMAFGQFIAQKICAGAYRALKTNQIVHEKCYLFEHCKELFKPLYSDKLQKLKSKRFLHNGAYPCYSIYKLRDANYVAVASVEEKFWKIIESKLKIPLSLNQRFNRDEESFKKVADVFKQFDIEQMNTFIAQNNCCLSTIRTQKES